MQIGIQTQLRQELSGSNVMDHQGAGVSDRKNTLFASEEPTTRRIILESAFTEDGLTATMDPHVPIKAA